MKNSDRQNRISKPFVPNGPVIFDISGGGKILRGWVILSGNVNVTGAGGGGAKKGVGGPIRLIDNIVLDANPLDSRYAGGRIIDKVHPESLLEYAVTERGFYVGDQGGANLGGNALAIANYVIYTAIPIYWAEPNLRRQVQTALNGDAYESLQIRVNCADVTNCFSGLVGQVVDYSGLTVQWVDDRENMAGDTITVFMEDHDFQVPAANKRALDLAMPKDGGFLSWLVLTLSTAAENYVDTVLNRLVINGDSLDYDKFAQDIRQQMFDDGWCSPDNGNPANPAAAATGKYFIDFTDGLLGGNIAAKFAQFYLDVNNPGGANQDIVRFHTRRVFPPVGYAPAGGAGAAKNQ